MKITLALVCILLPLLAHAATEADLAWTAPTTCEDGSPLTQCPVTGYKVEAAGDCAATRWNPLITVGTTSYHASNLAPGTYCFRVIATSANGDSAPGPAADSSRITITAPPPTCPAQPPSETRSQACVAPLIGSWSQTRVPQAVEPPACWAMGAWTPDVAPAGVCATPSALVTADQKAYVFKNATTPLALVGMVAAGAPCGPQTQIVNGVKYCRVSKSQVDMVVWPGDLALTDFWAKAQ